MLSGANAVFSEMSNAELEQESKKLQEQLQKSADNEGGELFVKAITERLPFSVLLRGKLVLRRVLTMKI